MFFDVLFLTLSCRSSKELAECILYELMIKITSQLPICTSGILWNTIRSLRHHGAAFVDFLPPGRCLRGPKA